VSVFVPDTVETRGERHGAAWPRNTYSSAFEAARVVKSGGGKLYGFSVFSSNVAAQFVLLFDQRTVPANGTVPVMCFPVAAASALLVGYGDTGRTFEGGCVLANSSTSSSLTAGSADCWFDVQYV
jgi:hypothetical protein